MEELCKHEMPPDQCGSCLGLYEETSLWNRGVTLEAEFPGWCADISCHDPIERGDTIVKWYMQGSRCYTHEGCKP